VYSPQSHISGLHLLVPLVMTSLLTTLPFTSRLLLWWFLQLHSCCGETPAVLYNLLQDNLQACVQHVPPAMSIAYSCCCWFAAAPATIENLANSLPIAILFQLLCFEAPMSMISLYRSTAELLQCREPPTATAHEVLGAVSTNLLFSIAKLFLPKWLHVQPLKT